MHVYCDRCGYDSGDFESDEEIAAKVNEDGGHMEMEYDGETGKPKGWAIYCPKCDDAEPETMHID